MRNKSELQSGRASQASVATGERLAIPSLAAHRGDRQRAGTIESRGTWSGPVPLSYAQERLWFLDQLGLIGAAYNVPMALRLEGDLDVEALERSFVELVRRHESLRTRFGVQDGVPHQLIDSPGHFELNRVDLSYEADANQRQRKLREWVLREQLHRFDLRAGPLLRVVLVKMRTSEQVLLITIHHIVCDGWSRGILYRELGGLYGAYSRGQPSSLRELPIQYADYAIWQRSWLKGEELGNRLQYWRERLSGAPQQLELPTDRPRPAVESFQGAELRFEVPTTLCRALREFGRREGATSFMVFLSAYQILLSRWSGQQDIVVGSPIAGRMNSVVEGLIGCFVNMLVMRMDVAVNLTFRQLLKRVKEIMLEAYEHQDIPFEALVKELRPDRNLTRQPIFQVVLALQNFPEERLTLPGLTWTLTGAERLTTHFDLTLYLYPVSDYLSGVFEYATDLFDKGTIERMTRNFRTLLEGIVKNPDCPLHQLRLLGEAEERQLVGEWNATVVPYPCDKLIHELFEEQVWRTPTATAVLYEQQRLTYAQLNGKANQLARYLKEEGVQVGEYIAVIMPRCLRMLVAQLAVLKSGSVYVPIDPTLPQERQEFIIRDCGARRILADQGVCAGFKREALQWINCAEMASAIDVCSSADLRLEIGSSIPAYVMYTSGSTGVPKGVVVPHRAVNRLAINNGYAEIEQTDCFAHCSNPAFDASTFEVWGALLSGASVLIVPQPVVMEPKQLAQVLSEQHVTVLWLTVGLFTQYAEPLAAVFSQLRYLLTGGDVVESSAVKQVLRNSPPRHLLNGYGPTECTTFSATHLIEDTEDEVKIVPIGRPISNTQIYILDNYLTPIPIGVPGEIYIGGAGVALGYLNRPEMTAERFIADPFSTEAAARLYKSGDLARWRANGSIEFIGRNDRQVKLRGFRVELGEIEAALIEHPAIKQSVVLASDHEISERRLVAYVVGNRSPAIAAASDLAPEKLRNAVVDEWERLYEQTYGAKRGANGPTFVGWNSSYTGQPIPEEEMEEWLTSTVERIQALRPRAVLEIGCGVGLVLQHLAPRCIKYVGTDFSASALESLRSWISRRGDLKHVELLHRPAMELQDLEPGSFDTVVLNSVVQYFPDIDYLVSVLKESVRLLAPGGRIFIGDVRHLGLLSMFHSAVQLAKAAATVSVGQLRRRIARALSQDKELVIDPEFFQVLPGGLPGISAVEVKLKRGRASNELTRYRYDVVLYVGLQSTSRAICEPLEWQAGIGSVTALHAALQERRWCAVSLNSIPNLRLARDAAAQKLIQTSDERLEASALRRKLTGLQFDAVDPDIFWAVGDAHDYDVYVSPSEHGSFEVQLLDRAQVDRIVHVISPPPDAMKPWSAYANDPLESGFRQRLVPELREYLKERLPEYMVPAAWVMLKELPVTPNGKVDRRALLAPQSRPEELGDYVPPQTELQRTLVDIWVQLLRVDQVGVQDNFFELGGHSLLATRVVTQINHVLEIDLPLRVLFENPTIEALADSIVKEITAEVSMELP